MKKNMKALTVRPNSKLEIGTPESNKVIETLIGEFQPLVDFASVVKGKKPTLLVPGADKLTFKFNLMARFVRDSEVLEMLKETRGLVALKCELVSRTTDKVVGEGRGSAVIGEGGNCKDVNSTVKMAEIRAKRDAVLNVFPIRDRFTQDMETQKEQVTLNVGQDGVLEV